MSKLLPLLIALVLTGCGAHPTAPAPSQLRTAQAARQALPVDQQIAQALAQQFPGARIDVHDIGEVAPGTFGFQADVVSRNRATMTHLDGEFDATSRTAHLLDQQTETR